ncbi:MAG: SDR family oxidoreductase [Dehalococcoidia bacterium]
MKASLEGKKAIVTGGASGIGRAIAVALARRGVQIAVLDIDETGAGETCRLTGDGGGPCVALPCDITVFAQVESTVARAEAHLGRIDVLVNNAGIGGGGPFLETSLEQVERQIAVNLTGHMIVSRAVLQRMVPHRSGVIVNVASDAGTVGVERAAAYGAAKGGMISLTRSLAKEFARHGIRVNCVCPGPTDSPMFQAFVARDPERARKHIDRVPMKRPATPEEVAGAVAFLASDAAGYITGLVLAVDGGFTMAP